MSNERIVESTPFEVDPDLRRTGRSGRWFRRGRDIVVSEYNPRAERQEVARQAARADLDQAELDAPSRGEAEFETGWFGETELGAPILSPLAVSSGPLRRQQTRTLPVYGLCVHTTSGGPARQAKGKGKAPLQIALDYYLRGREGFPHYVIDYDGTIHAVCDEGHIAWHAGWLTIGGKKRWASWTAPAWWSTVWRRWNVASPADLLPPPARDPNEVYIGVELLADVTGYGFTSAQYDALARLALDVARRHNFTISAAPSPRLLGHEDLDPIERAKGFGGWDPGAHRTDPKFSWAALWLRIQALGATGGQPFGAPAAQPIPARPSGSVSSFSDLLRRAFGADSPLASFLGVTEAVAAFARGQRDANRLADIIFHARHQERGGRPIARGETRLAQEWLWIRDSVVRPALLRAAAAPTATPPTAPATAPAGTPAASQFACGRSARQRALALAPAETLRRMALLVPLLERYRGDIPLEFLLGWIAVESNGCIDEVTNLNERGFFQIHPDESKDRRFQHERLTTDPDYSVQAGIRNVRFYADLARQRFPSIPDGSELFWRIVKLQHAMGSGLTRTLLGSMRASNIALSWEAIKRYELTNGPRLHRLLTVEPLGRFGRNVDGTFARGREIARALGKPSSLARGDAASP